MSGSRPAKSCLRVIWRIGRWRRRRTTNQRMKRGGESTRRERIARNRRWRTVSSGRRWSSQRRRRESRRPRTSGAREIAPSLRGEGEARVFTFLLLYWRWGRRGWRQRRGRESRPPRTSGAREIAPSLRGAGETRLFTFSLLHWRRGQREFAEDGGRPCTGDSGDVALAAAQHLVAENGKCDGLERAAVNADVSGGDHLEIGKLGRDHAHQGWVLRAAAGDDQLVNGTTRENEAAACVGDRSRGEGGDGGDQIVVNDFHAAGVGDDRIEEVSPEFLAAG